MSIPSSNYSNQNERWRDQMAQMTQYVVPSVVDASGSISASNTYGTIVQCFGDSRALLALAGTFVATIVVQCALSTAVAPTRWYDLACYTSAQVKVIDPGTSCSLRVGVKTAKYTSGTVKWALRTGGRP